MREGTIKIHETSVHVWESGVEETVLRREVFDPIVRHLRARGWHIGRDPHVHRHYRSISKCHRRATKAGLVAGLRISGRCIRFELDHALQRAESPPMMPRLIKLEFARLTSFLVDLHGYEVEAHLVEADVMKRIERDYTASSHRDPVLGRPRWHSDRERTTADGAILEQGQTVFVLDYSKRRVLRGRAFFNINNMWWVVLGPKWLRNVSCGEIYTAPPTMPTRESQRRRRTMLERKLHEAVERLDFRRAETLKRILFGDAPVFRVRSEKGWWGPQSSGYHQSRATAGLYTEHEVPRGEGLKVELVGEVQHV